MDNIALSGLISSGEFIIWVGYALVFFAVFLIAKVFLQEEESRQAEENLGALRGRETRNPLLKIARPFFSQYLVPKIRGKEIFDIKRRTYRRKIIASGLSSEITPDEMIAFKVFSIIFFPVLGAFLVVGEFIDLPWYAIVLSSALGWFYPDIWVNGRIKARQLLIVRSMPFIVDLLALSTEAGLDFMAAASKVVDKAQPGPLVDEFAQLLKEIKVGSSRQEALREMGSRIDLPAMNSFIAILISSDQMGTPIGRVLKQQSDQIRNERMVRAEKLGAQAATKIIFPTVLLVLPAIGLLAMGPLIIQALGGGAQ